MATVRVIDLLFASEMHDARIAAGWRGLRNPVNSYTVAGEPDVGDWLRGGEAVFSTAFFVKNDVAATLNWIESLSDKGASCLGLKAGRFLGEVPREVLDLCNSRDLPLLLLPDHTTWASLFKSLFQFEESSEWSSLNDVLAVSGHWLDLLHHEAGQRLDVVLDEFYKATGTPVFMMSSDGVVLACSSGQSEDLMGLWQNHLITMNHKAPVRLAIQGHGMATRILPETSNVWLIFPQEDQESNRFLNRLLTAMIGGFLPDGWPIEQQTQVLSSLICGDGPLPDGALARSKWRLNKPGYVAVATIEPQLFSYRNIQDLLGQGLGQNVGWHFINGRRLVLGISAGSISHRKLHHDLATEIYQSLRSHQLATVLSVGPLARTLEQYRLSYRLAGLIAESPWAKELTGPARFAETAMFLGTSGQASLNMIWAYMNVFIQPLLVESNRDLFVTLKTLLQNKLSITVTAQQLFLHPNTVKYRVAKLEELLDFDLSTPSSLASLIWILGVLELKIIPTA